MSMLSYCHAQEKSRLLLLAEAVLIRLVFLEYERRELIFSFFHLFFSRTELESRGQKNVLWEE
jgi:hypothetical protein